VLVSEHLFIVSRHHPGLYGYLSREFSDEADVTVILDRRAGERRVRGERRRVSSRGDRRQTDRRVHGEIASQINSLGYAFVRLS
jgi:hypothetical protein